MVSAAHSMIARLSISTHVLDRTPTGTTLAGAPRVFRWIHLWLHSSSACLLSPVPLHLSWPLFPPCARLPPPVVPAWEHRCTTLRLCQLPLAPTKRLPTLNVKTFFKAVSASWRAWLRAPHTISFWGDWANHALVLASPDASWKTYSSGQASVGLSVETGRPSSCLIAGHADRWPLLTFLVA